MAVLNKLCVSFLGGSIRSRSASSIAVDIFEQHQGTHILQVRILYFFNKERQRQFRLMYDLFFFFSVLSKSKKELKLSNYCFLSEQHNFFHLYKLYSVCTNPYLVIASPRFTFSVVLLVKQKAFSSVYSYV